MLLTPDGYEFCCGATQYESKPVSVRERLNKLSIFVKIDGEPIEAVVDTGGAFSVLSSVIAHELYIDPAQALEREVLTVRGFTVPGTLYRLAIVIEADAGMGDGIEFDVSAFVPDGDWDLPSFLGWHACLERIRFAVDLESELFYFGASE